MTFALATALIGLASPCAAEPCSVPICAQAADQVYPRSVPDGAGGVLATWLDYAGIPLGGIPMIRVKRFDPHGVELWAAPVNVAHGSTPYLVVPDEAGGAIVVWTDGAYPNLDLKAMRIDGSGAPVWTPAIATVVSAPGLDNLSCARPDGSHGVLVAWTKQGADDIYAQRLSDTGVQLWPAAGAPVCTATGSQTAPSIVTDGLGGAYIAWTDKRVADGDVYAQRLDATGAAVWALDGIPVASGVHRQSVTFGMPSLVAGAAGGALVCWLDLDATDHELQVQRLDETGAATWASAAQLFVPSFGTKYFLLEDGLGGAFVTWTDMRNGNSDVYAQHVGSTGALLWSGPSVAVCTALGSQDFPYPCRDGSGGLFVSWEDHGRNAIAHVQHLVADGTRSPSWPVGGMALCDSSGPQYPSGAPSSDGAGGVFIQVSRSGAGMDAYLARIGPSGDRLAVGPDAPGDEVRFAIRKVMSNPSTSDRLGTEVELPGAGHARLELIDVAGRIVATSGLEAPSAGRYPMQLSLDAGQPPGIYLLRLRFGARDTATRIALVR